MPERVFEFAETIRDAVIDAYADNALALPARRAVVEGTPAFDCEALMVELRRLYRGIPGQEGLGDARCMGPRVAEYHVWIVRCVSVPTESGDPPSVASQESFAQPIYTDAWVLPSQMQRLASSGELGAACDAILVGPLNVIMPQGAFGGVELAIEWQVS